MYKITALCLKYSQNQHLENGTIKAPWTTCTWTGCKVLVLSVTGFACACASMSV